MDDFNTIPVFLTVVKEKSFSRAAEILGISTPAVSKRISKLEINLGVKLLHRTTRKLSLTESGQRYYEYLLQASDAIRSAENAAIENKDIPAGKLRINTHQGFADSHLGALIASFLKKYPLVEIQLVAVDVFDEVNFENFDLILTTKDIHYPFYKAIQVEKETGITCASPEFLAEWGIPSTPEDLKNFNCLLYSFHQVPDEWVFIKDGNETKVKISGNLKSNNPNVVRDAALNGLGIASLPTVLVDKAINSGELVPLFSEYSLPGRTFRVLFQEKQYSPIKVKLFIEFLINSINEKDLVNVSFG